MQEDEYQVVERIPTVEEYLALREAVGWGRLDEQVTARGLTHALFTVCLVHEGNVIGCGRVIGDEGLYFYLQDIIVLPAFQGKGLGKRLMEANYGVSGGTCSSRGFRRTHGSKGCEQFLHAIWFCYSPT